MSEFALDTNGVRFFSGQSHPELAAGIASFLSVPLERTHFSRFSNDNLYIQLGASVRGRVVFIVQSLIPPVSDHLLELLMMLDIARSAGANQVHAIIPYFSYARSDKKDAPRISITARLVADLLQTSGATHVMTMTLHSPQVHGFFSLPTDPLTARHLFVNYLRDQDLDPKSTVVVSPDMGRAQPAARFATQLALPLAAAQKQRLSDTSVKVSGAVLRRQVKGFRHALVYDDEIATGTTVLTVCQELLEVGIKDISVICTHGVFAGKALQRLTDFKEIKQIITTNTVPPPKNPPEKLTVLSVADIFGEAIYRNYTHQSIGVLYSFGDGREDDDL